ncbi:type II toxin-antitoxin system RatA family toxin [Maritimibacter fusiformis]|uniref:Type II toxin-antitoxin system RatA family toxin n=1 Tax=Maritimibacter fusiformis TaxID=2603819 RepID=A0A5D0RIN5_9RHOB|nr:type II toxin-antitoxin system RatA family toxin [Maritimibacter fusiformis]TYB81467.1 type II toxin-antitoxin system RatA family toxin [Maritimibacter fusiformis]
MPTHAEKRIVPYTAQQMFDLVADVGHYPAFLPWISAARVRMRTEREDGTVAMEADLVVSFKVFRETFGSRVVLDPGKMRIDTSYLDGPFKYLKSYWVFRDLGEKSEIEFFVDFEFKSAVLQKLIGVVFNEAMRRSVKAFEDRAAALYGGGG